jgi:arabinose-5-phosphate isomerase
MRTDLSNLLNNYIDEAVECIQRLQNQSAALQEAARRIASAVGICTVGVGKSAFVAQKMAASLRSIAIPANFIHAGEALHGDLGGVRSSDLVIVFSKSGNSDELKALLPLVQKRGSPLITVTNRSDSAIGKSSSLVIDIGVRNEGDELNLIPLISVDVSMVVANLITSMVASITELTPQKFRENHPGGQLGFAVGLTLRDLRTWQERKPFVRAEEKVLDAILLMSKHRAGLACVLDDTGVLLGILTDGDLRSALAMDENLHLTPVSKWMNMKSITLRETMAVSDALAEMELGERKVFAAPVLNASNKCVGVVTIHDLMR